MTTFGVFGPQAAQLFGPADFYSAKCAVDRGVGRRQLVERLQVALLQEVGKRLLAAVQAGDEEDWANGMVGSA